jgi:hypothetical protein
MRRLRERIAHRMLDAVTYGSRFIVGMLLLLTGSELARGHMMTAGALALASASWVLTVTVIWAWWPRAIQTLRKTITIDIVAARSMYVDAEEGHRQWLVDIAGRAGLHVEFVDGLDGTPNARVKLIDPALHTE